MDATTTTVGDHLDIIDTIDSLRHRGVNHWIDLPEIIVCGDQSAGKSSVLEAISRWSFPTKDGLCTRFATELVLRWGQRESVKVSITPGKTRFGEDKERLQNWRPQGPPIDKGGLGRVTQAAEEAMAGTTGGRRAFYDDILRIELTGPGQPHLTMVDLPGLFHAGDKEQPDDYIPVVLNMLKTFMARRRSIILTVVSAQVGFNLQKVRKLAKEADPNGTRTLGLITKPDTLDVGSDTEQFFVDLAQNLKEEHHLRLGWHVLKNRTFQERDVDSDQRDAIESRFFDQGSWHSVEPSYCGVAMLKTRLSRILRDQIMVQLPSLVKEVEEGIEDCTKKLHQLGPVRSTVKQQLSYLMRVSEDYTSLATQAVHGTYTHRFFGNRNDVEEFPTRLRAVIQHQLAEFGDEMRLHGQNQHIIESDSDEEEEDNNDDGESENEDEEEALQPDKAIEYDDDGDAIRDTPTISRSDYIDKVKDRLKFSRGRELDGLFNPLIVTDLFVEQCKPWRGIAERLVKNVLNAVHLTARLIVEQITAGDVTRRVLSLIREGIDNLAVEMTNQVDTLLASAAQHPITYNPQLAETVQRAQQARNTRAMKRLVRKTFGRNRFANPDSKINLNLQEILDLLGKSIEPDMEQFGSALAVDYMEAYYKVAVNRFVDDVSVLAIEDCLLRQISTLFRSSLVLEMSDEAVSELAGETRECSDERSRLENKLTTLETGLRRLKRALEQSNVMDAPEQDEQGQADAEHDQAPPPDAEDDQQPPRDDEPDQVVANDAQQTLAVRASSSQEVVVINSQSEPDVQEHVVEELSPSPDIATVSEVEEEEEEEL